MQTLLDFSKPFDVPLFENTIRILYDSKHPQHAEAHGVVVALRESVETWQFVDKILRESADVQTQFVALQILEDCVRYRWKAIPVEQRQGIRNWTTEKLVTLSNEAGGLEKHRVLVQRLNLVLVQILKQEWPHNWPSFIPDLVGSAKTSESLCENNMVILQLLSEEVFEFSKDELTAAKTKLMKETMNEQFQSVFQLCDIVLDRGSKERLLSQTLKTVLRFLNWIPLGYIFQSPLIERLLTKFFPSQKFRNEALSCLTEIASLTSTDTVAYAEVFVNLYKSVMQKLVEGMLPLEVNVAQEYERVKENDRDFVQQLALFISGFIGAHLDLLERPENHQILLVSLEYLLKISEVDNPEVFKICLDAWNRLAADLYQTECAATRNILIISQKPFAHNFGGSGGGNTVADQEDDYDDGEDDLPPFAAPLNTSASLGSTIMPSPRKQLYAPVLSKLRGVMISHMARPEEVLVTTNENNEVVREAVKDTDAIDLYKQMRDTLVYLTHLDVDDTESIMLGRLVEQCDERLGLYSVHNINTLSWAIGSISGAMDENMEKTFLVAVIKDLLVLCEQKSGKDNKALIASDIMYVVGQYPRFLRMHWKFLRTVVQKLFEFMHEPHPGVQDMACDTFLKLTKKCRRKFIQIQSQEPRPYIDQLLDSLAFHTSDLQPHQVHSFYEAVGVILVSHPDRDARAEYLKRLMVYPNRGWMDIMSQAAASVETLQDPQKMMELSKILRTNLHVCKATGHSFLTQLGELYADMLNVYKSYGDYINYHVVSHGANILSFPVVRSMRGIKQEILDVLQLFVEKSDDPTFVAAQVVTGLFDPICGDYEAAVWQAREPKVLELFSTCVAKLKHEMTPFVPRMMHSLIAPTLSMITANFEDFPEHRTFFYQLLNHINANCFVAMWNATPEVQKRTVDSIGWGIKHTERDIADCSLDVLHQLLRNMATHPEVAQAFYATYLMGIIQDLLFVLTDRLHKSGFKMHATLLRDIFSMVESGQVQTPLFDVSRFPPGTTNASYLREYVSNLMAVAFPNVAVLHVQQFVHGLFDNRGMDLNAFKQHLRDFLIQLKEFSAENNDELFSEEKQQRLEAEKRALMQQRLQVPGLMRPAERDDMADL